MKNFNDLIWKEHPIAKEAKLSGLSIFEENRNAEQAVMIFDNGFGISVIRNCPLINDGHKFEFAVLKGTKDKWKIVYDTPITNNVERVDASQDITSAMEKIQRLKL